MFRVHAHGQAEVHHAKAPIPLVDEVVLVGEGDGIDKAACQDEVAGVECSGSEARLSTDQAERTSSCLEDPDMAGVVGRVALEMLFFVTGVKELDNVVGVLHEVELVFLVFGFVELQLVGGSLAVDLFLLACCTLFGGEFL